MHYVHVMKGRCTVPRLHNKLHTAYYGGLVNIIRVVDFINEINFIDFISLQQGVLGETPWLQSFEQTFRCSLVTLCWQYEVVYMFPSKY